MGGRRLGRRAAHVLLAATVALSIAAGLASSGAFAFAAEASSISASPSPIPAGDTLAVTGTVFGWAANCEIVIGGNAVPESTCFVAKDALTATLTIPSNYVAGTYVITACSSQCPSLNASAPTFTATRLNLPLVVSTTVDVEPAAAPPTPPVVVPSPATPTPRLVVVPQVVGMTLAAAVAALRGDGLVPEYGTAPPNAHVSGENPAAGTLAEVRSRVPLTLVSWVPVPDLAKLTLPLAAAAASPLKVRSKTSKGRVKSQTPAPGGLVSPTTVIAVTLVDGQTNYALIAAAGGGALVVLVAVLAGGRAFVRRRHRIARRWYHDHVRLASTPVVGAGRRPRPPRLGRLSPAISANGRARYATADVRT
jgi:hypothetical protein